MARRGRPCSLNSTAKRQIRYARNAWVTLQWLAKFYGVSVATVARVR